MPDLQPSVSGGEGSVWLKMSGIFCKILFMTSLVEHESSDI